MRWSEKELCIKCNKNGKLLVSLAELEQARENARLKKKALAIFIDNKVEDGNFQNEGATNGSVDERSHPSMSDEQINKSLGRLKSDARRTKEDPCHPVGGHQSGSGPIIAYGDASIDSDNETSQQFEFVEIRQRVQNKQKLSMEGNAGAKTRRTFGADQVDGLWCDSSAAVKKEKANALEAQAKRRRKDSRDEEKELIQEDVPETDVSCTDEHLASAQEEKDRETVKTDDSSSGEFKAVKKYPRNGKRKGRKACQPVEVDCPRRPPSEVRSKLQNGKFGTSNTCKTDLRLEQLKVSFSNARRQKWTEEEEEMLKEGIQKFTNDIKKNIPWRKILYFGRHVFHKSRAPADLKDKWRKMLAK